MPFVVHTEKLNLISSVAAEVKDEIHTKLRQHQRRPNGSIERNNNDNENVVDEDEDDRRIRTEQAHKHELEHNGDHSTVDDNPHPDVTSLESRWYEMNALFQLAVPTMTIQLGQVVPGFAIASYIGRTYSNDISYLDGYTLGSLTANLFTLSLLLGLYTASDTLSPQAYGAGNRKEVGYLAIRGFIASMIGVLPIILLLVRYMAPMLLWMGEDRSSVAHACTWFSIYSLSIPFYGLYQVTMKFLSAQNQMRPLVVCCLISSCIVLPLSLYALGPMYGYVGTAIAMAVYQSFQAISLIVYIWIFQPHDPSTWSGLLDGIQNAMQWKPLVEYMELGAGGILAMSEWIYWEALALLIGTFGIVPLSVHTIPANIIMITFMGPYSLGIALSIRLGATLPVLVSRAKQTTIDCFAVSVTVFGAVAVIMYVQQDWLISLFTTSEAVIDGCHEIWWDVCLYSFVLSVYGIHMGACVGLGMQWTLGTATIVSLWMVGLPSTYFLSAVKGGGIQMAWSLIWPPYILLPIVLTISIVRADWDAIARDIRKREGIELTDGGRPSFLLSPTRDRKNATNSKSQPQHHSYGSII